MARAEGRWVGIGVASYAELTGVGSRIAVAPGMPINTGTETCNVAIDPTGAVTASFGIASRVREWKRRWRRWWRKSWACRRRRRDPRRHVCSVAWHRHLCRRGAVFGGGAGGWRPRRSGKRSSGWRAICWRPRKKRSKPATEMSGSGTDRAMTVRDLARALYSDMGRVPRTCATRSTI